MVVCPEEVAYQVKSLSALAARKLATLQTVDESMPTHLKELVEREKAVDADGGDGEEKAPWLPFEMKSRDCETVKCGLKIGNFACFPMFDTQVNPTMFSINLAVEIQHTVRFLILTRQYLSFLLDADALVHTCTVRYPAWMKLQAAHLDMRLLPPLDVAFVWFSHMLQSLEYHQFAQSIHEGLQWIPHCSAWAHGESLEAARLVSEKMWSSAVSASEPFEKAGHFSWTATTSNVNPGAGASSSEPFEKNGSFSWTIDLSPPAVKGKRLPVCGKEAADPRLQVSGFSYSRDVDARFVAAPQTIYVRDLSALPQLPQMVKDDADWFDNFLASQGFSSLTAPVFSSSLGGAAAVASARAAAEVTLSSGTAAAKPPPQMLEVSESDAASFVVAYQRYLYLCCKYERRMEWCGFAPTPAIDLVWHTHLLRPRSYFYDVAFICNTKPVMHKLLPQEARTEFVYEHHRSHEAALWLEEFGESLDALLKPIPVVDEEEW